MGLFGLLLLINACSGKPDDAPYSSSDGVESSEGNVAGGTGESDSAGTTGSSYEPDESTTGGSSATTGQASGPETTSDGSSDCDESCTAGVQPPVQECDIVAQDCLEGEKCTPYASDGGPFWDGTMCVPVQPDAVPPGEPCHTLDGPTSGHDNCDGESMCFHVDPDTLEGVCVEFCYGEQYPFECSDPLAQCHWANDGVLAVCLTDCDPMEQDCGEGQGCYPKGDTFGCDYDDSNGQGVGKPCTLHKECPVGMFCAPGMYAPACQAEACCAEFCDPNGDSSECWGSNEGVTCMPLDQLEDGYEPGVGVCGAP